VRSAAEIATPRGDIVVTGASGVVGRFLVPLLCEAGFLVWAISRRPVEARRTPLGSEPGASGCVRWISADLARGWPSSPAAASAARAVPTAEPLDPVAVLIHAAPIWLLPPLLPGLADQGLRRLVAFSSTSRFTKRDSASRGERELARRLAEAEKAVESIDPERGIAWTIFRPTLIYGGGRDRNVSEIARVARRFGFVPVAGAARGARQPVHAGDLARAALAVLDNPATFFKAYDLPGGETLTYAELVARTARGVGRRPRLLHLPTSVLRVALGLARCLPSFAGLTPGMADRMNEDLRFDPGPARRDFGYAPRAFAYPDVSEDRDRAR
jgi:nucleoside-diphosphate-sugar epimerase